MQSIYETLNDLNPSALFKFVLTAVVIVIFFTSKWLIKKSISRLGRKYQHELNRTAATKRILIISLYAVTLVTLVIVWGGDLNNLWVSLGSILGVIAIGFFAIWSILSNIVAGIIIYTINPFKITDTLVLVEKEVSGKVKDIGLIYTTLEDEDGIFTVPNNLFFQQVVKVKFKNK